MIRKENQLFILEMCHTTYCFLEIVHADGGYDERVRFYPDFGSRMYFMEAVHTHPKKDGTV